MKVVYIGECNILAKSFFNKMTKEGNELFVIATKDFPKKEKSGNSYKYYSLSKNLENSKNLIMNIKPQVVVYGGNSYLKKFWTQGKETFDYISQLTYFLDQCCKQEDIKFIYLSSLEVYGEKIGNVEENSELSPYTVKGLLMASCENLISLYCKNSKLKNVILRCSDIFTTTSNPNDEDFLRLMINEINNNNEVKLDVDEIYQPISLNDVAEAINRAINGPDNIIYNICSTNSINKITILKLLSKYMNKNVIISCNKEIEKDNQFIYSNYLARKKIEWLDFKSFLEILEDKTLKINYDVDKKNIEKINKKSYSPRKCIENIIIFGVFFMISIFTKDNALFETVDWMMIYVVSISLLYGVSGSILAVALAIITYLIGERTVLFEINTLSVHIKSILKMAEYIFVGISISYAIEMLREDIRSKQLNIDIISGEKKEIEEINTENIMIKNEYEKRLLDAKNSLPALHSMISRVNVLEPDRIFVEILRVVSNVIGSNTVCVYSAKKESSYLRLITQLNKESVISGKSWNLNDNPNIYQAIKNEEIFVGNRWENEPAFVAPIMHAGVCIAVIVIKDMPFESQTLYQINLLRTLAVLFSESVTKAMKFESLIESTRYIMDTDILTQEEFFKCVDFAYEKKAKQVSDCCIIKCTMTDNYLDIYAKISTLFRDNDVIGLSENDNLCILLNNSTDDQAKTVLNRMNLRGVDGLIINDFHKVGKILK